MTRTGCHVTLLAISTKERHLLLNPSAFSVLSFISWCVSFVCLFSVSKYCFVRLAYLFVWTYFYFIHLHFSGYTLNFTMASYIILFRTQLPFCRGVCLFFTCMFIKTAFLMFRSVIFVCFWCIAAWLWLFSPLGKCYIGFNLFLSIVVQFESSCLLTAIEMFIFTITPHSILCAAIIFQC